MRFVLVAIFLLFLSGVCSLLHGTPSALVQPDSLYMEMPAESVAADTLWLTNTGADTLHFTSWDDDERSPLRDSGGPDAYGYVWQDSDDPAGPDFAWVEISTVGTQLSLYDDDDIQVVLPFTFPFYGVNRSTVRINSNGYLSFGWSGSELNNTGLPNSGFPNSLICGFWDDLKPLGWDNGYDWGSVYYWFDSANQRYIVEYHAVSHFHLNTPVNPETFEIILYPDGTILMQYLSLSLSYLCTVGIENDAGTVGLQMACNETYLHNGLAICLYIPPTPDWLAEETTGGAVPPGQTLPLVLNYSTAGVEDGQYRRYLHLATDDPAQPQITVPVGLNVATPRFSAPGALSFGSIPVYETSQMELNLSNTGTAALHGYLCCPAPFTLQGGSGQCDSLQFTIAAGGTCSVNVTFAPPLAQTYLRTLTACTTAGDTSIALSGTGYWTPHISAVPDTLVVSLTPGGHTTTTLSVGNSGIGTLHYTANIVYPASRDSLTILYEGFDDGLPGTWTVVNGGNSNDTWMGVTDYNGQSIDGTPFAIANSDAAGSHTLNEQLITPSFNVSSAAGLYLEFDQFFYVYELGGSEVADVDVWNGVSWQNVYRRTVTTGSWSNPSHVTLNLIDHLNDDLKVRFHYYNAVWDWFWAIDNVKLWGYCNCMYHWLTINDGTTYSDSIVTGGANDNLTIDLNTLGLNPGVYHADLLFRTNDPDQPQYVVPVIMTVMNDDVRPQNLTLTIELPNAVLSWDAVAGAGWYTVYAADNADGPWTEVYGGALPAVNGTVTWSEELSAARRFYKVTAGFDD